MAERAGGAGLWGLDAAPDVPLPTGNLLPGMPGGGRADVCPVTPASLPLPDVLPPWNQPARRAGTWRYLDAAGRLLFLVVRFDLQNPDGSPLLSRSGKVRKRLPALVCCAAAGGAEWRWLRYPPVPSPLYGLPALSARPGAPVLVVEGEKAADAAAVIFPTHVAVTWPGGSDRAGKADWSPLKGRRVIVWPDNDRPGRRAAAMVMRRLKAIGVARATEVHVPKDWPQGWDLADAVPARAGREALAGILPPVAAHGRPPFHAAATNPFGAAG